MIRFHDTAELRPRSRRTTGRRRGSKRGFRPEQKGNFRATVTGKAVAVRLAERRPDGALVAAVARIGARAGCAACRKFGCCVPCLFAVGNNVLLSKPCQYAILAMSHLAEQSRGEFIAIREIGEMAAVPLPFLAKIVSSLSRSGLLSARRGPRGGVKLSRPPAEITVGDIVAAVDGTLEASGCALGFPFCSDEVPCPVHESWSKVRAEIETTLYARTLEDLVRQPRRRR